MFDFFDMICCGDFPDEDDSIYNEDDYYEYMEDVTECDGYIADIIEVIR